MPSYFQVLNTYQDAGPKEFGTDRTIVLPAIKN
jgi:hypothetical protein